MNESQQNLKAQMESNFDIDKPGERCFTFYDWFAEDKVLRGKAVRLGSKVRKLVEANSKAAHPLVDPAKVYVFFKNNCPAGWGPLYDSFSICSWPEGDVLFWVCPKQGVYQKKNYYRRNSWGGSSESEHGPVEYHAELAGHRDGKVTSEFESDIVGKNNVGFWDEIIKFFETGRVIDPVALAKKMLERS